MRTLPLSSSSENDATKLPDYPSSPVVSCIPRTFQHLFSQYQKNGACTTTLRYSKQATMDTIPASEPSSFSSPHHVFLPYPVPLPPFPPPPYEGPQSSGELWRNAAGGLPDEDEVVNMCRKNLEWCVRDWEKQKADVERQQQILKEKPTALQAQLVEWVARLVDPAETSIWRAAQMLEVAKRIRYWDQARQSLLRNESRERDEKRESRERDKKSEDPKNMRNNSAECFWEKEETLGRFILMVGLLVALAAIITFAALTFFGGARPQERPIQRPPYIVHVYCHLSVNYIEAL